MGWVLGGWKAAFHYLLHALREYISRILFWQKERTGPQLPQD